MTEEKCNLDFGPVLQAAFELYKQHFGLLVLVNLVAMLISAVTFGILAGPLYAGIALIMLRLIDRQEPRPEFGDVFKGFDYFLPSFLYMLVLIAVSFVVSMLVGPLSGVVGYVLSAITVFSIYFIVERKLDFWPAITESYETVKENFFLYLALVLVASVLSSVGIIACCIGIIFTAPFYACVTAVLYRTRFPQGEAESAENTAAQEPEVLPPAE